MDTLPALRKRAKKFPVKDLAKAAGLSRGYVCELVQGEKSNPSLTAFQKLSKAVTKLEKQAASQPKQIQPL